MPPPAKAPATGFRLLGAPARLARIYQNEIWQADSLHEHSLKGALYAVLRVVSITITVISESRVASRAAALSFSSLLGLGPLLAIAVLVAGFALGKNEPHVIANTLHDILRFLAPQIQQYEHLTQQPTDINPALVDLLNGVIEAAQSGAAGAVGATSLIVIVLLLFKSIEDTFNDIWGVRQGRSVLMRIVFYWTILTLGAVLFFTSIALLSAGTLVNVFWDRLPGGETLRSLNWVLQLFSFSLLTAMLTLVYRVIPNTRVFWRAAVAGALVVAMLLMLNNFIQFLYVKRVVMERSLYGSLAILPVLMFGLYVFWLCVLIGGIVSYAIQNVHFRNSQAAWNTLTHSAHERLELIVFLAICRNFRECLPPVSASKLSELLKVPTQLLNECLNRLVHLKLIATVRPEPGKTSTDYLYLPARPLNRITLFDFKRLEENFGDDPIGGALERIDPLVKHYHLALNRLGGDGFFQRPLEDLLNEHPLDDSRATPTMRQRVDEAVARHGARS